MAKIDVLIPAYNAAGTLREAIESLQRQTVADIRILVVNDGSTDSTAALLDEISLADPRVHVITKANDGIVEARNDGFNACTAEFFACLDADDVVLPDRFERQLAYLHAHPDCVAVGGHVAHIDEHGAPLAGLPQPGQSSLVNAASAPAVEPYIVHSTLMARRADVAAAGGYRHVPNSEDSDLFWRLGERGSLFIIPETMAKYRVHAASISSSIVNGRIMAIGSQLGALSALRRRAGKPDLAFPRALHAAMKAAVTLEGMFKPAAAGLATDEADHLRIASATKLMELARYRPFEPDTADCAFIRSALPHAGTLSARNQREVKWYITTTAARLMRKGKWAEVFTLTPPKSYPAATARMLLAR